MPIYAAKANFKNITRADTSSFAKNTDLATLKSDADKSDIDKLKNLPTNLNNLKSKADKLDFDKLVPVPVYLSKLIDVVKNDVVKKTEYNKLVKISETENKITTDHDHDKYITTQEFNKLTADNFTARLKQANLASKNDIANFVNNTDFDNKLLSFNKRINSNKSKHVLVENELNELSKKVEAINKRINKRFDKWI